MMPFFSSLVAPKVSVWQLAVRYVEIVYRLLKMQRVRRDAHITKTVSSTKLTRVIPHLLQMEIVHKGFSHDRLFRVFVAGQPFSADLGTGVFGAVAMVTLLT